MLTARDVGAACKLRSLAEINSLAGLYSAWPALTAVPSAQFAPQDWRDFMSLVEAASSASLPRTAHPNDYCLETFGRVE